MNFATVALGLQLVDLPEGRKLSHHVVFLTKDGEEGEPLEVVGNTVRFEELEPGTYTATASSLADDGSVLTGPFVSPSITIHGPTAAIEQAEVVRSLTFTLENDDMNDTTKGTPEQQAAEVDPKTNQALDPNHSLERHGNAEGHADQEEVATDAATKKTDDGTATTGPSDSH